MKADDYRALLVLSMAMLGALAWRAGGLYFGVEGFLFPDGPPFGNDFINLWTTARLVLEGQLSVIYDPAAFAAYQIAFIGQEIGHRLWAYPPHSLSVFWPFGLMPYAVSFALFSLFGLAVLYLGCRRVGLTRIETAIVVLSPATIACLHNGQTGLFATGLLLVALTAPATVPAVFSAILLTVKPQMGILLPFVWLKEKRWLEIGLATLGAAALLGVTFVLFGPLVFTHYLASTLPELSLLERHGSGLFTLMIPSLFMALRILGVDGDLAIALHIAVAAPLAVCVIWRLLNTDDAHRRIAQALSGTALLTPYIHQYDLNIVLIAALLSLRRVGGIKRGLLLGKTAAWLALLLPIGVVLLNSLGLPLGPLVLLLVWLLG